MTQPGFHRVSFLDMFTSLSTALDLVNARLGDHHKLTCYIASMIAQEMGITGRDYDTLFSAAMVHDIGATSLTDRLDILRFETEVPQDHAVMGEAILKAVEPLADTAPLVRDHHVPWRNGRGQTNGGHEVSELSHIIHAADRAAVLVDRNRPVFLQSQDIRDTVSEASGRFLPPHIVEAFCDLSTRHDFWLRMDGAFLEDSIKDVSRLKDATLSVRELEELSSIYAFIIDSRSRFTASHSSGVAAVAEALALAHGVSDEQATLIKIAGYLHDIGKLSVPGEILEKNGTLSDEERLVIKGHSFYTQKIIAKVRGMEQVGLWAAQHHEFIDGSGYPFGLSGDALPLESRILTIADIFTALTEDRPYRMGMALDHALGMLMNFMQRGMIDADVFQSLETHAADIDAIRRDAQRRENEKLGRFWKSVEERVDLSRMAADRTQDEHAQSGDGAEHA